MLTNEDLKNTASMVRVVVASTNPVKVAAAKLGYQHMFPQAIVDVEGVNVSSGVSDQPRGDAETRRGAVQRAAAARQSRPDADIWIGIEGGVDVIDGQMFAFAWSVVRTIAQLGEARSGTFPLPPAVCRRIEQGTELGTAIDDVFGQTNSKQHGGAIGILSGGQISRTDLYEHAIALALLPIVPCPIQGDCGTELQVWGETG